MVRQALIFIMVIIFLWVPTYSMENNFPEYTTNPFTFPVAEPVAGWGSDIFVVDLNGDGLLDYTFRSETKLYAYDHYGTFLWNTSIRNPGINHGTKFGAADIDGDGQVEIAALDDSNRVFIYNGSNGNIENIIPLTVGPGQKAAHIVVANLRGNGDHDAVIQTNDTTAAGGGIEYYINRTLIALNLENGSELWRVEQDNDPNSPVLRPDGIYEGYWGQAHGGLMCADVDGDGLDEVIGGNMVDNDGTVIDLGYTKKWVNENHSAKFIDHLDCIAVGDFRPDLPGLEWVMTEEDHLPGPVYDNYWHTTMLHYDPANPSNGIIWTKETNLFENESYREPEEVNIGDFDPDRPYCEVWNRSRFNAFNGNSQHPWVYDAYGNQFADFRMDQVLPPGFNSHSRGNGEGIEVIWTIDWFGGPKDYIVGEARHVKGNVGLFDAITGEAIWTTMGSDPSIETGSLYVADVAGDSREEIIIYNEYDGKIKVFWNSKDNPYPPKPNKWNDPLYRRLKQNWNYYSPGSYTWGDYPVISKVTVSNVTANSVTIRWETNEPCDSQVEYGETDSYGLQTTRNGVQTSNHAVELTALQANTEYHYRVKSRNIYGELEISRDHSFTTGQEITVSSPNGGEYWIIGSVQPITWTSKGAGDHVIIELSRDGGEIWDTLFTAAPNNGSKTWTVTGYASANCSIKIIDGDGYPIDVSDEKFTIADTSKKLVFVTPPQTIYTREVSSPITLEVQDSLEESIVLESNITISLQTTSPTGKFSLDSLSWNPVTNITIPSGHNSVTFYYKDNSPGNPTITASDSPSIGWTDAVQQQTVILKKDDTISPELVHCYPPDNAKGIPENTPIQFEILDPQPGYGVDSTTINVFLNGTPTILNGTDQTEGHVSISPVSLGYIIKYSPASNFSEGDTTTIRVQSKDLASLPNSLDTTYTFTVSPSRVIETCRNSVNQNGGVVKDSFTGIEITIPADALDDTTEIRIGIVSNPPTLPDTVNPINNRIYHFGPDGLCFSDSVTISLPYTQVDMNSAGIDEPTDIPIYYFSTRSGEWTRLNVINASGNYISVKVKEFCYLIYAMVITTNVEKDRAGRSDPTEFVLMQNYPNPFNPETSFEYQLPKDCNVLIHIYDLMGREVKRLVHEHQQAGYYTVKWDGRNSRGNIVPSGIYLLLIQADTFSDMLKMTLVR